MIVPCAAARRSHGTSVPVVVIAEDRDDIAGLCVRHLRDVQHAHVHTDPPDNGNQLPAQIEACLSGQQAAQAVGVADGQDGDAGIMRRSVKPSVADIRPAGTVRTCAIMECSDIMGRRLIAPSSSSDGALP